MMFFGAKTATSAAPTRGLTFGAASTTAPAFPSFGSSQTTTAPVFGFGGQAAAPSFSAPQFGASTAPSLFGGIGAPKASTGFSFGTTTSAAPTAFSGFGKQNGAPPAAAATAAAAAAASPQQMEAFLVSLSQPLIFGDERDHVLARWNQLQAMYGSGVGYCVRGPVPYSAENPFCRLKTVAYNVMPAAKDEDGLVMLLLNKRPAEVTAQKQQVLDALFRFLGNKANLAVELEDVREAAGENKTEVLISVTERLPTGSSRKVLASELAAYLSGNMVRPQLESQLAVQRIAAHTAPSASQLSQYLERPPAGLNPIAWHQARADNPNESRFLPVPVVGFQDIKRRMLSQEAQAERQQDRLQKISDDIAELKCQQTNAGVRIEQMKRRQMELSLRVLKVLCRQETVRQQGCSLSAEEEALRCALEKLWNELVVPCGAKSRLQEMLSTIRMGEQAFRREQGIGVGGPKLQFDAETSMEIRDHLMKQQEGIQHLIAVVREDLDSLKIMENGLAKGATNLR